PDDERVNWLDRRIDDLIRYVKRTPGAVPFWVLTFFTGLWAFRFSHLVILRNDRYGSFDFDAGIYNQAGRLFSPRSQFDTVRGLPLFGHHVSFGFYLFAPFYWLGLDGQTVINVSQVLALAAVPLIAFWVARRLKIEPWFAMLVGFVCLLNFTTTWLS